MMMDNHKVKKGGLFTFATGDYSDYCVNGLYRALADIDFRELRDYGNPTQEEKISLLKKAREMAEAQESNRKKMRAAGIKPLGKQKATEDAVEENFAYLCRWDDDRFTANLIRNELVEPVDYEEFHLGSYGDAPEWAKE